MQQQIVHSLIATLLLVQSMLPSAWAQTRKEQAANDSPTEEILVARTPCAQHEDVPRCADDSQTLPHFAQHRPSLVVPTQMPYPRSRDYETTWPQRGNGRHALIGTHRLCYRRCHRRQRQSRPTHSRAHRCTYLFGGFGALIGAAVGASHP
jgi:hypothetical protein